MAALAFASLLGCSKQVPLASPAAPLTQPTRLCGEGEGEGEGPPRCRPAAQVENLLEDELEILSMSDTPSGSQGAKLLTLRAPRRGSVLRVKWRAQSDADLINEPRKELAAYAVQKLFLEPHELVAPPTVVHCFALESYRAHDPHAKASFADIDCVLGFASLWLEDVQSVSGARKKGWLHPGDGILDPQLFADDALYRSSIGKANLLTYMINHGDAHSEQFLLERAPAGLRAYVVDSSIAFRSIKNPMLLLRQDWSSIQVPKLPERPLRRLAALSDADYARLACVATLVRRDRRLTAEHPPHCSATDATMSWQGPRLRIGLSRGEIDLVHQRARELLQRADLAQLTDSLVARP